MAEYTRVERDHEKAVVRNVSDFNFVHVAVFAVRYWRVRSGRACVFQKYYFTRKDLRIVMIGGNGGEKNVVFLTKLLSARVCFGCSESARVGRCCMGMGMQEWEEVT